MHLLQFFNVGAKKIQALVLSTEILATSLNSLISSHSLDVSNQFYLAFASRSLRVLEAISKRRWDEVGVMYHWRYRFEFRKTVAHKIG